MDRLSLDLGIGQDGLEDSDMIMPPKLAMAATPFGVGICFLYEGRARVLCIPLESCGDIMEALREASEVSSALAAEEEGGAN